MIKNQQGKTSESKEKIVQNYNQSDNFSKSQKIQQASQKYSQNFPQSIAFQKEKYVNSPYYEKYKKQMINSNDPLNLDKYAKIFISNGVHHNKEMNGLLKIDISPSFKSKTLKIIEFMCHLSHFSFKLKVLNLTSEDQIRFRLSRPINEGAFGSIFEIKMKGKQFALKLLPLVQPISYIIQNTLKQFMIMKICSLLNAAPQFTDLFGFEVITTDQVVMFGCEKGIIIEEYLEHHCESQEQIDLKFAKLLQKLALMHKLSITHNDIKPDNIVYSLSLKQLVFIDFGLSEVNEQQVGFMKVQSAKGSLNFCGDQMRALLISNCRLGYVDVYHNDLCGLQKSIVSVKQYYRTITSRKLFFNRDLVQNEYQEEYELNYDQHDSIDFNNNNQVQPFHIQSQNKLQQYETQFLSKHRQTIKGDLIYFLSLVYQLNLGRLLSVFIEKQSMIRLIYSNFQKVYFIFFELEISFELYNIFCRLIQAFNEIKISLNFETQQIIQKLLQPYFRAFIQERQVGKHNLIFLKYLKEKKTALYKLEKRYVQSKLLSISDIFICQSDNMANENESENESKIIEIDLSNDFSVEACRIFKKIYNSSSSTRLSTFLNSILASFRIQIKRYNLTSEKFNIFTSIFTNLGINISFKKDAQITIFQKIFICVRFLATILLQLIKDFSVTQIIQQQLYQLTHQNQQKQISVRNKDISNQCLNQKQQEDNSQLNKKESLFFLNFKNQHKFALTTFHKTLVGLQNLCNLGFEDDSFSQQLKFNQIVLDTLDQKIYEAFRCQKYLQSAKFSKIDYKLQGLRNFCLFTEEKSFEIRYLIMKQTFSRVDQYYHLLGAVTLRTKYIEYGHLKDLFQVQKSQNLLNLVISKINQLNMRIHGDNQVQIEFEEQIYMIVICKLILPSFLYKEYGWMRKIQNLIDKLLLSRTRSKYIDSIKTYLLTIKLTSNIQEGQILQAINIVKKVMISKDRIILPSFYQICYNFFKHIHNSKLCKQFKRKMLEINSSDFVFNNQSITSVKQSIQKFETEPFPNININKNQNPQQFSSFTYQNDYFQKTDQIIFANQSLGQILKSFLKAWIKVTSKGFQPQNMMHRLINLRNIIIKLIYRLGQGQEQIVKKFLMKYQIEQHDSINYINEYFIKVKESPKIIKQIYLYLDLSMKHSPNQSHFVQNIFMETVFFTRIKLLKELISNHLSGTQNIAKLVQYQWQRFSKFVSETYLKNQIEPFLLYFEIKCKVFQILFSSYSSSKQKTELFCLQYIESTLDYLKKINNPKANQYRFILDNKQQNQKKMYLPNKSNTDFKVDLQIYINFFLHIYEKKINVQEDFLLFYTKKLLKKKMPNYKRLVQNQLIEVFYQQFSHQNGGKIFIFSNPYLFLISVLIQIGSSQIFIDINKSQIKKDDEVNDKILRGDIIIFIVETVVQFTRHFPCSSYSSFMIVLFQKIKMNMIKQVSKSVNQNNLKDILERIDQFQVKIKIKIAQKYKKLRSAEFNLLFLVCQLVKYFLIKHNIDNVSQSRSIEYQNTCMRKIKKSLSRLSLIVEDIPFLMKLFAQNQIYNILVSLNKLQKLQTNTLLQKEKIYENSFYRSQKRIEICYFRSCRRVREKSLFESNVLNLNSSQSYYESFPLINIQIVKSLIDKIIKKREQSRFQGTQKYVYLKNLNNIKRKIQLFLLNIE